MANPRREAVDDSMIALMFRTNDEENLSTQNDMHHPDVDRLLIYLALVCMQPLVPEPNL